jgi:hypothetical protein
MDRRRRQYDLAADREPPQAARGSPVREYSPPGRWQSGRRRVARCRRRSRAALPRSPSPGRADSTSMARTLAFSATSKRVARIAWTRASYWSWSCSAVCSTFRPLPSPLVRRRGSPARSRARSNDLWRPHLHGRSDHSVRRASPPNIACNLHNLSLDQLSGRLHGDGPGWLSTTRLDDGKFSTAIAGPAAASHGDSSRRRAPRQPARGSIYLHVEFSRAMDGNVNGADTSSSPTMCSRSLGPCPTGRRNSTGAILIPPASREWRCAASDSAVGQMPGATRLTRPPPSWKPPARRLSRGRSSWRAAPVSRTRRRKTCCCWRGDGRSDAEFFRKPSANPLKPDTVARTIMYWRRDNRIEISGGKYIDLSPLHLGHDEGRRVAPSDALLLLYDGLPVCRYLQAVRRTSSPSVFACPARPLSDVTTRNHRADSRDFAQFRSLALSPSLRNRHCSSRKTLNVNGSSPYDFSGRYNLRFAFLCGIVANWHHSCSEL